MSTYNIININVIYSISTCIIYVTVINSPQTITDDIEEEGVIYGVTIGNEGSTIYGEQCVLGYNLFILK